MAKEINPTVLEWTPTENSGNLRGLFAVQVGPCEFRKLRLVQQQGQAPFCTPPQESYTDKQGQRRFVTLVKWPAEWSRPVENTDGSPLTNLSGYVLYYGTGFPVPYSAIFIDASATSLEIQNLSPGNWYFQIESVNAEGMSSELSPTVFKTIQ